MDKYKVLGMMKEHKVSFKTAADAIGEAPLTLKRHFEDDRLDTHEIKVLSKLIGVNDLLDAAHIFLTRL